MSKDESDFDAPHSGRVCRILTVSGIVGLALLTRIWDWGRFFQGGHFLPCCPDSYYHMRRIFLIQSHFPWVPHFDSYIAYPYGAEVFWPPLFDWGIACLAMAFGLGAPSAHATEVIAGFFSPVVGTLILLPLFLFARRLWGHWQACAAALLYALLPGCIAYATVGRVDHHILVAFFGFSFIAALALGEGLPSAVLAGVLLGCGFLTLPECLVFVFILLIYLFVSCLLTPGALRPLKRSAVALAVCLFMILPFSMHSSWTAKGGAAYPGLSYCHILVMSLALVAVAAMQQLGRRLTGGRRSLGIVGVLAAFLLASGGAAVFLPGVAGALRLYSAHLGHANRWLATVLEDQPLFLFRWKWRPELPELLFSRAIYLLPIGLLLVFVRLRKKDDREPFLLFLVLAICLSVLTLWKQRFFVHFGIVFSILLAHLLFAAWGVGRGIVGKGKRRAFGLGFSAVACFLFLPVLSHYFAPQLLASVRKTEKSGTAESRGGIGDLFGVSASYAGFAPRYAPLDRAWYEAFLWMRNHTPQTSDYDNPMKRPEYGVLAHWTLGHYIEYVARRPVLANPNGTDLGHPQLFFDALGFYLLPDAQAAYDILDHYGVRYVVTLPPLGYLKDYAYMVEVPEEEFLVKKASTERRTVRSRFYYRMMGTRLHDACGTGYALAGGSGMVAPLRRFRLVYVSPKVERPSYCPPMPDLKIFEYVKGAALCGAAAPGQRISLRLLVKANSGVVFKYCDDATADASGRFSFRVPYPTQDGPYGTGAVGPYALSFGGMQTKTVNVSEDDVLAGREIEIK
ncbi:MAG: hypothetical protein GXP25_03785 [Planctomycetes bacterium]|nr:hypothetical protein [Planctomycetota bacterium]